MGIVEETRRAGYDSVTSKRADRSDVILAVLGDKQMTVSEIVKASVEKKALNLRRRNDKISYGV